MCSPFSSDLLAFYILLLYFVFLHSVSDGKKSWPYRGMKKLSKSEVDIKSYLFPCSLDESKLLNSTFDWKNKHLLKCKKKLVIKMVIQSGGECSKSDGFIPIDHVIDGISGRKKRLLNPLMIRIKREKMYQLYDLQLITTINAEAKEEVINYENAENFTGCDTSSSRPTCGFSFFNNKIIQFSEGFCCSCDQAKNDERQPCDGPSDRKKMLSAERVIRHYRSNRSSRAIDLLESESKTNNLNSVNFKNEHNDIKKLHAHLSVPQNIYPTNLNKISSNGLQQKTTENTLAKGFFKNITIRSFHFERTHAPHNPKSENHNSLSILNMIAESRDNVKENGKKHQCGQQNNNSVSGDAMKILILNNIKENKNGEKVSSIVTIPVYNTKSSLKSSLPYFAKVGQRAFVKELATEEDILSRRNNKFNIQISAKEPKETYTVENKHEDRRYKMWPEQLSGKPYFSKIKLSNPESMNDLVQHINYHSAVSDIINKSALEEGRQEVIKTKNENTSELGSGTFQVPSIKSSMHSEIETFEHPDSLIEFENRIKETYIKKKTSLLNQDSNKASIVNQNDSFQSNLPRQISEPLNHFRILRSDMDLDEDQINNSLNMMLDGQERIIEKREMCNKQKRGGQSCSRKNKYIPCKANKETYFESAHCLRFSELWYNVHKLVNPRMENSITVKIYNKHKTPDKKICWENLTKRLHGRIGTVNEVLTDGLNTILITYSSNDKVAFSLDCAGDYLLVPQPIHKRCKDAELKELCAGGPEEFLLLKENEITFDGEECDKAGVTYSAFARQPHRCQHEAGSCLKNQPLHFWRDDKKAAAKGKPGQYFLSNFITLTDQSVLLNTSSNQVVLRAPYIERYQSNVVVELNADHLDIIADKSEAQITEVYIDATSEKSALIKVVVTNMGIASDLFGIDFVNCSSPLGPCDLDKPGKDEVPPQHRITYTATIYSTVLHKRTDCNAVVLNIDQEVVAVRHIVIVRGQRCMCVWHCECVCHNHLDTDLPCTPLSLHDYNNAGFPGQMPVLTWSSCSMLFSVVQGLIWLFFFLLLFGLIKAILGLCFANVGVWGLWYILPDEALNLYCYMEPHLACYSLVRDCDGYPIHPKTFKRTVHFLPWYTEFGLNVFFFVCVLRCCICDGLSRTASSVMYSQYQPMCADKGRCSPGANSPYCGSACSNMRKFRLSAGGGSKQAINFDKPYPEEKMAKQYVSKLSKSFVVFRNLSQPIGGVLADPGVNYCVRGFFMESNNDVFQFYPPSPLMQMWQMDGSPLDPPVVLDPAPFRVMYRSTREAMAAQELSREAQYIVINAP